MADSRWIQLRDLVSRALDLEEGEREAFLEREAGDDASLLAEAKKLLASALKDDSFLIAPHVEHVQSLHRIGDFEIRSEIGRGGMGVVYRAHQPSLNRDVALKVLVESLVTPESLVARFHREARSAAKLRHPGIVQVFTDGNEGSTHWFAMELVDGLDLHRELELHREKTPHAARLPALDESHSITFAARICAEAAEALQAAHESGVIHRDIKPHNLLLDSDNRVRIADFGLARDESLGAITRSGDIAGTPHYMSPEQARAQHNRVDARTDIYSLGVVLYELMTHRRPFVGDTAHEILTHIQTKQAKNARFYNKRIPRDLDLICATAMAKEPGDRYASAGAFAADLRRFLNHRAIEARPPSAWTRTRRWLARRKAIVGILAVGIGALGVGAWLAHQSALARESESRLSTMRRALSKAVWSTDDFELLKQARLAASAHDPSDPQVVLFRRRLSETQLAWRAEGQRLIDEGCRTGVDTGFGRVDESLVLRGLGVLHTTAALFPDDLETAKLIAEDPLAARVDIRVVDERDRPVDCGLSAGRIDLVLGTMHDPIDLGKSPALARRLPAGMYRFRVESERFGLREFTRVLRRAASAQLTFRLYEARPRNMLRVSGGTLFMPEKPRLIATHGRRLEVDAFDLDRTEVSNAEYRVFTQATGHDEPPYWSQLREDQLSLPVVQISWYDARAYAEWAGARLPTFAEWMWAARGSEQRRVPWSKLPTTPMRGNVAHPRLAHHTGQQAVAEYLLRARPVDSAPDAATPDGLLNMLGNVAEWTESPFAEPLVSGGFTPRPWRRIYAGHAWDIGGTNKDLSNAFGFKGPERAHATSKIGFRCARSIRND